MHKLVLLRHGQSQWNLDNRFTGWTDVDLTGLGREEAKKAGALLKAAGIEPDLGYTSVLKRAIRTLWIALDEMDRMWLPVTRTWRLNERHYGALQGLNKAETTEKYGEDQVHDWRRGYAILPPELEKADERHPSHDVRYASLTDEERPGTESLAKTVERMIPYWETELAPRIREGKTLFIVAHGNSLRALVKHLDQISDEEIPSLNIPTGIPLVYELDKNLQPIKNGYLGDPEAAEKAAAEVAAQAKAKK